MSFWDRLFGMVFRRRAETPPPEAPPAPRPAPTPPPAPAPVPPVPPPGPPPVTPPPVAPPPVAPPPAAPEPTPPPVAPPPVAPPAAPPAPPPVAPPPVAPPPAPAPTTSLDLATLRAQDASRIGATQVAQLAASLQIEPAAIQAVLQIESAGPGFGTDGRPLILFEPTAFSELTGGRHDASHPHLSQGALQRADLGRTQGERWAKLTEASALDQNAALQATSWGVFQIPGRYHAACGYPDVIAFARDMAVSEVRQLAAFERYLRAMSLVDELQRKDWEGFARIYEGPAGTSRYAGLLQQAYTQIVRAQPQQHFLDTLGRESSVRIGTADYAAVAQRFGCEPEAVQAVVEVESGAAGAYGPDGRPIILFEPHIFSRRTQRRYDQSHPNISYPQWDPSKYPRSQAARWDQMRAAYALDPEQAVASASWGLFQVMGFNFEPCGFPNAIAFVDDMSKSERRQLAAFEAYVRSRGLVDEMQRLDWEGFARGYNGPGQVERYGRLLRTAYNRLKGLPTS